MKKILVITLFCSACYVSDELPPDQDVWGYDLPRNQQFDQNQLLLLNTRIQDQEFGEVEGLSIIRNNNIVFENYYVNQANRAYTRNIGRTGLIISLAALGVAVDQRLISVDDSIYKFLPEYSNIFESDPIKKNIRVIDVLTHRTGLDWNERIEPLFVFNNDTVEENLENNLNQMKRSDDWVEFVLSRTPVGIGFFSFNTANGVLLAKILENATNSDFSSFVQDEIFGPLEINHLQIEQDALGNYNGGDGYDLTLLDFSKIGYLFLNEGIWKSRTLLNINFVKDAITRQHQFSQTSVENSIGYFWTFFGNEFQSALGFNYEDIFFLVGERGQAVFVLPNEDMVITILSDNLFGFNFQSINLFSEITRMNVPQ